MKKNILFLILALAFAAVSCQKTKVADKFVIERTECTADYEGGSVSVVVNTNLAWTMTAQDNYDWLTPSCTSGNGVGDVFFVVSANTGEERTAKYTFSAGSFEPIEVSITQEAVKSEMKLGVPFISQNPVVGKDNSLIIAVPYEDALGGESREFVITPTSETTEFTATTVVSKDFKAGKGNVLLTMNCKPATLGFVEVKLTVGNEVLGNLNVGVFEAPTHTKYIAWNFWAIGYSRADFCYVRGSKYDLSWTSEAINATTSGNTLDHKVLASTCTIAGNEEAYFSAYSSISIVAGGKTIAPNKDPQDLAGYTFNPGIQIKGMVKDDYFFVYLPKVSVAAGGKFSVEGSVGGAKAAANFYIAEYSTDNKNWVEFDNAKTDCVVSDVTYPYHFGYLTTYATRNTYSRDVTVDPAYAVATATAKSAINGPLYIRLRSTGITGGKALITAGGWGDVKFLEVIFD